MPRKNPRKTFKKRAPSRRFGVKNAQWWVKQGMRGKRKGSLKRVARRALNYAVKTAFKRRRFLTTGARGQAKIKFTK